MSSWQLLSLLSNAGVTRNVQDCAFELIIPLPFVVQAKDPELQLACWIEFLSTFDFEVVSTRTLTSEC